jgi:hypothetical protein
LTFNEGLRLQLPSGLDTISRIQNPPVEGPVQEIINDDGVVVDEQDGGDW